MAQHDVVVGAGTDWAGQVRPTTAVVVAWRSRPSSKEAASPAALVGGPAAEEGASRSPAASMVGLRRAAVAGGVAP